MNSGKIVADGWTDRRVEKSKVLQEVLADLKRPTGQPEALLDGGFHGRAALVGSMAFFTLGTEQYRQQCHPV